MNSPESVDRGKALFAEKGCAECHGDAGRGGQRFDEETGHAVFARDLSAPWTFRGGNRQQDIWLRLTTVCPGPMPAYADVLPADARWDLANFVVSLARTPAWEKGGSFGGEGFAANPAERGDYVTRWRYAACVIPKSTAPGFTISTVRFSRVVCVSATIRTAIR